jgi:hypothetical protein
VSEKTSEWQPLTLGESDALTEKHIANGGYAYQVGDRRRYTEAGWDIWQRMTAIVDLRLSWHDVGCVKRYGAVSDGKCECEKRLG